MKEIHSKMKVLECSQHFPHRKSLGVISDIQGQLIPRPWSDLVEFQNYLRLYGCPRYLQKEDPIKKESAGVITTLYIDFSDAQGQITPDSVVRSGQNLNSFKLSCISLLPASLEMIKLK